jgi:acyl carrier protein
MSEQVLDRVREIAGSVLERTVTVDDSPSTVEAWDSIKHMNLMLAIEEEFGFAFLPDEMDEAKSIGQIARLVASKRG